jgi:hypothetical protein
MGQVNGSGGRGPVRFGPEQTNFFVRPEWRGIHEVKLHLPVFSSQKVARGQMHFSQWLEDVGDAHALDQGVAFVPPPRARIALKRWD